MKAYKQRRRYIEIRWRAMGWVVAEKNQTIYSGWMVKKQAICAGAAFCREIRWHGGLAELVIKNKDGKIGKGSGARRSYGSDQEPRRRGLPGAGARALAAGGVCRIGSPWLGASARRTSSHG